MFEKYIWTTITKETESFKSELTEYKVETTRDISRHKNNLKLELDKKMKTMDDKVSRVNKRLDKLSGFLNSEEVKHTQAIAEQGRKIMKQTLQKLSGK